MRTRPLVFRRWFAALTFSNEHSVTVLYPRYINALFIFFCTMLRPKFGVQTDRVLRPAKEIENDEFREAFSW